MHEKRNIGTITADLFAWFAFQKKTSANIRAI